MVGYDGSLTVRVSATQPRLSFRLSFASVSRQSRGAPGRRNETVESASARRSIACLVRDGQPLAFVAAVRALLADWEHSVPRGR
jgi:hypothetical protein